jgi:hypothetical protein
MHVCSGIICVIIHHWSLFRAAENRSVEGVDQAFRHSTGITFPVIVMEPVCSTRRDQRCQLSQLLSIIKPGAITAQNIVITEVVILIGFNSSLMLHLYAMSEGWENQSYEKPVKFPLKIQHNNLTTCKSSYGFHRQPFHWSNLKQKGKKGHPEMTISLIMPGMNLLKVPE